MGSDVPYMPSVVVGPATGDLDVTKLLELLLTTNAYDSFQPQQKELILREACSTMLAAFRACRRQLKTVCPLAEEADPNN